MFDGYWVPSMQTFLNIYIYFWMRTNEQNRTVHTLKKVQLYEENM